VSRKVEEEAKQLFASYFKNNELWTAYIVAFVVAQSIVLASSGEPLRYPAHNSSA
jgi:hypothetical protein